MRGQRPRAAPTGRRGGEGGQPAATNRGSAAARAAGLQRGRWAYLDPNATPRALSGVEPRCLGRRSMPALCPCTCWGLRRLERTLRRDQGALQLRAG